MCDLFWVLAGCWAVITIAGCVVAVYYAAKGRD